MEYTAQIIKNNIALRCRTYFVGDKEYLLPYAINLVSLPEQTTKTSLDAICVMANSIDNAGCMVATEIFLTTMLYIYAQARRTGVISGNRD